MELADYGEGIGNATSVMRNNAAAAGLDAPVPTCPGWTVRDLVVHQGVVHRWATGILTGAPADQTWDRLTAAGADGASDLLDWLDDGVVDLLNTIVATPDDAAAWFFLKNAPAPKLGWARRQCHETTIHAVDAMSARLGAPPSAEQLWFGPALAADGVDEILRGFLPRAKYRLRSATPYRVLVTATDVTEPNVTEPDATGAGRTPGTWHLAIGPDPVDTTYPSPRPAAENGTNDAPAAEVTVSGTAADLYLALWNRGDEITVAGSAPQSPGEPWLQTWRRDVQVI